MSDKTEGGSPDSRVLSFRARKYYRTCQRCGRAFVGEGQQSSWCADCREDLLCEKAATEALAREAGFSCAYDHQCAQLFACGLLDCGMPLREVGRATHLSDGELHMVADLVARNPEGTKPEDLIARYSHVHPRAQRAAAEVVEVLQAWLRRPLICMSDPE